MAAASRGVTWFQKTAVFLCLFAAGALSQTFRDVPAHFRSDWYSYESGEGIHTMINYERISNKKFSGKFKDFKKIPKSHEVYFDGYALFHQEKTTTSSECYMCFELRYRSINILQTRYSNCQSGNPTLEKVCQPLYSTQGVQYVTYFRKALKKVNCKTTFEGVYQFTYKQTEGGGGVCSSGKSLISACQEPGSPYVDNEVFKMYFGFCPAITSSFHAGIRFQCMGTWTEKGGNIYSAIANLGANNEEDKFRCLMTNEDQKRDDMKKLYVMSIHPTCAKLTTIGVGPVELVLTPELSEDQYKQIEPTCNFPMDYIGNWFTTGEYDSNVVINNTHIYFYTKLDQYHFRETFFTCQQNRESRYLMAAVTRGKCEVDYICFDFLPRQHNIIRYRMAKPYRLTTAERKMEGFIAKKFLEACSWSSFNFNQEEWKYNTLILDPPNPVPCPIAGMYAFKQIGLASEKYRDRIRGITERPWMQVDCRQYEQQFKVCRQDLKKILIDARRCVTLDMIARPIGEYDRWDHELLCVGYWMEDSKSYLITYDEEDPNSKYRCWVYQRLDWKNILMSKASRSACHVKQTATSYSSAEGASLALELFEWEREFDECPQWFADGEQDLSNRPDLLYPAGSTMTRASILTALLVVLASFILHVLH